MPGLTEEMKDAVSKAMHAALHRVGEITEENAPKLADNRTVQKLLKSKQIKPADAAWAWIAEQREWGLIPGNIERRFQGIRGKVVPYWEEIAKAKTGWTEAAREVLTERSCAVLVQTERVWRQIVVVEAEERTHANAMLGVEREGDEMVRMSARREERVWQNVKRSFKGTGGRSSFRACVALLMLEGKVEGNCAEGARQQQWWQEAEGLAGKLGKQPRGTVSNEQSARKMMGSVTSGHNSNVRVGVDLMACTQSARAPIEAEGLVYVGLDIQEEVWSAKENAWVKNVKCDVLEETPENIMRKVRDAVREWCGEVHVEITYLWCSPDCATFTPLDSMNAPLGTGYRDHTQEHRPPLQGPETYYGQKARKADQMAKTVLKIISSWVKMHPRMKWVMENPVGSLARQKYVEEWKEKYRREVVHYCSYEHHYHKPTHIWTNIWRWKLTGTTGSGRCEKKCKSWELDAKTGKWGHRWRIGRESNRECGGKGRKANKNMVPQRLHEELLRAALTRG